MPKIFLSYRREDGISQTGRIYDRLIARYGDEDVFMDLGKISIGAEFVHTLDEKLNSCEIFIAVIGAHWLISRKQRKRMEDPDDFVRREVATALKRGVRIIPVLLDTALMPRPADLPADIAELANRSALRIREDRFDPDMDGLILELEEPDRPPEDTLLDRWDRLRYEVHQRRKALWTGFAVVAMAALAGWANVFDLLTLDTRMETLSMWLGDLIEKPKPSDAVVIVGIDAATEKKIGREFDRSWRAEHAVLVERLAQAKAKAVAFDMYFEEPSAQDDRFATAIARARAPRSQELGMPVYIGARSFAGDVPKLVPALREKVSGVGLLCVVERLSYASSAPLFAGRRERQSDGGAWRDKRLGLGVLAALGGSPSTAPSTSERELLVPVGDRVRQIFIAESRELTVHHAGCPALRQGDELASTLIRLSDLNAWRSATHRIAYEDIVRAPPGAELDKRLEALKGKIILVGVTGTAVAPELLSVVHGLRVEQRFGVELHAEVVHNLIGPMQIHPLHWGGQLFLTAASVAVATVVWLFAAGMHRYWRWTVLALAVLVYLGLAAYLCAKHYVLLNCVYHLAAFAIGYWLLSRISQQRTSQ
jgi:CHASE2 domain-containing sensor protein